MDIKACLRDVRFTPESGHSAAAMELMVGPNDRQ
jgi:hypothetical protein